MAEEFIVTMPDGRKAHWSGEKPPTASDLDALYKSAGGKPQGKPQSTPSAKASPSADAIKEATTQEQERTQGGREAIGGFGRQLLADVARLTAPISRRVMGQTPEQYESLVKSTEPETPSGKAGGTAARMAEFAGPGGAAKAVGLVGKTALAAEGAGIYGLSKFQGDPHAAATALISMVPGFATLKSPQQWFASAQGTMTKILESAAKAKNEDTVKQAVAKVLPLAMDRSLLQVTKGKWAEAVKVAKEVAGKNVGTVLQSTVGDEPLPIAPIIKELDALKAQHTAIVRESASKLSQVRSGVGGTAGATGVASPVVGGSMVAILDELQTGLREAGREAGAIQARELVKFKRDWDRYVYKAKPFLDPEALVDFKKEALKTAADSVRRVIATTPGVELLSKVDSVMHQHQQLYNLISEVAFEAPYMPPSFGIKKQIAKQVLKATIMSPTWRLASVKAKMALGDAMVSGSLPRLRAASTAILAGATQGDTEEAESE